MKINKQKYSILIATILFCLALSAANAQTTHKTEAEAKKAAGQGVTFKFPDGFAPGEFSGFKGVLALNLKRPAGIFVSYPNQNETIEELSARIRKTIVPMFVHDEKEASNGQWRTAEVPVHLGDKTASMNFFENDKQIVQVAIYEREWQGLSFVYGYFAMKDKSDKKSKDFLDESGAGVKEFEKFWKTFPTAAK